MYRDSVSLLTNALTHASRSTPGWKALALLQVAFCSFVPCHIKNFENYRRFRCRRDLCGPCVKQRNWQG